jgi:hypothetical protein
VAKTSWGAPRRQLHMDQTVSRSRELIRCAANTKARYDRLAPSLPSPFPASDVSIVSADGRIDQSPTSHAYSRNTDSETKRFADGQFQVTTLSGVICSHGSGGCGALLVQENGNG